MKCVNIINILLIVLLQYFTLILSFNLEVRLPVIKRSVEKNNSNSYFGYSVAEHRDNSNKPWILVGAPLGQNLQPNTNRSGALYRCPITTSETDCQQVITDGRRPEDNLLNPPGYDEQKDNQWLGVSLRSSSNDTHGGRIVVCAHRYVVKSTNQTRWGQGLCYTLTADFIFDDIWEPCKGRPVQRGLEEYGFCQAGTSSALIEDTMILGAPGPYTWKGTVYVMSVLDSFIDRDTTIYYGPLSDNDAPIKKYSYLGMSVTAGRYFGERISYAAGAPRSEGTGEVVFFTKLTAINPMAVSFVLSGEQFASSFGYEVATADVNGDGLPDLLVAAPFYFVREEEGGAVYIYLNDNHSFSKQYSLRLTGATESRFGFAIANLGDLNKDGCEDIAIGAPYEGNGVVYIYLGSKKGLNDKPAQVIPSESLPGTPTIRTFGYSLSGGSDLDNNKYPDLLIGAYENDSVILLRGRPIIDIETVILGNLTHIDPSVRGCVADPTSNYTCFFFQTCASIKDGPEILNITYNIQAETFAGNRKFSRVWFGKDESRLSSRNTNITMIKNVSHCENVTVYLREDAQDILSPIQFYLNYALIQEDPVLPSSGEPLPSMDDFPILNQTQAERSFSASFQKDCGADDICNSQLRLNATLLSDLPADHYRLVLGSGKDRFINLFVSLENQMDPAYEARLFISHPPGIDFVSGLTKETQENPQVFCQYHNETFVICNLGNPFKKDTREEFVIKFDPKKLADTTNSITFVVFANSTSIELDPELPHTIHASVMISADLKLTGEHKPNQVFYGGDVRGESAVTYLNEIGTRLTHEYTLYNGGPWKAPRFEVQVDWPYQVGNDKPQGKWLLYMDDIPFVDPSDRGICKIPKMHLNPLSLGKRPGFEEPPLESLLDPRGTTLPPMLNGTESSVQHIRRRRDTEMIVKAEAYTEDGVTKKRVNMNCESNTAKCFKFVCDIYGMQKGEYIRIIIPALLWNSTLVEDYPKVHVVNIKSTAKIVIPKEFTVVQETENDDIYSVSIPAYPDLLDQQDAGSVPPWIIVVSIVAGLLILIILCVLLWKFGFFKRRRPDATLSGNIKKNDEDSPFLN